MANIVTAKELGGYLKLSDSTIYKLASSGEIPGFKIGDSWRFDLDEIILMIRKAKHEKHKKGGEEKAIPDVKEIDEPDREAQG